MAADGSVSLGDRVKDRITDFEGIVVGIYMYLHGCRRIGVEPKVDSEGKMKKGATFDEGSLEIIEHLAYVPDDGPGPSRSIATPEPEKGGPPLYMDEGRLI